MQGRVFTIVTVLALSLYATESLAKEIPRKPNGRPDFSGLYTMGPFNAVAPTEAPDPFARGAIAIPGTFQTRDGTAFSLEADSAVRERGHLPKPQYRPEHWERVRHLDLEGNKEDPAFRCMPAGVFRMGPPQKIVQTETELIFLYPSAGNVFRVIPIDGRKENAFLAQEQTYTGYSRGRFEGDKLIIDSIGFNGNVWLGWAGWFTSEDLRVVEEIWWQDGKLMWQPSAYDSVLLEPYTDNAKAMTPHPKPDADLFMDTPCEERDLESFENIGSKIRG